MSGEETSTDPYYSLETTDDNPTLPNPTPSSPTLTSAKQDLEDHLGLGSDASLTIDFDAELETGQHLLTTTATATATTTTNYDEPLLPNSSHTLRRQEEKEEDENSKSMFYTLGLSSALFLLLLTISIVKQSPMQPHDDIIPNISTDDTTPIIDTDDDQHYNPDPNPNPNPKPYDQSNLKDKCKEYIFPQRLDHFSQSNHDTYNQRYFLCDEDWQPGGPIFFYLGNEANVELYLTHSGLMWENAAEFGAMLIFAEHRYFGESIPVVESVDAHDNVEVLDMSYLSSEQALADYATLIHALKEDMPDARHSAVIGFGGSYGGMLASWFRMKYPHVVDGVIAGSAPILSFLGDDLDSNDDDNDDANNSSESDDGNDDNDGGLDSGGYARVMTFDASSEAGAAANCPSNIRSVWGLLYKYGATSEGREMISDSLQLCDPIESVDEIDSLNEWIKDAYSSMSMGNYPYPSSYLLDGDGMLPAYPMRVACEPLQEPDMVNDPKVLLEGVRQSIATFYNATGSSLCFDRGSAVNNSTQNDVNFWGYLYCTEMTMPFSTNGETDMFWKEDMNWTDLIDGCQSEWGVTPDLNWASTFYGGRKALETASNIVFSNGNYDPWSAYGVLPDMKEVVGNPNIVSVMIDGGAHHLDLMFSHPDDPTSVIEARNVELDEIRKWIESASTSTSV